MALDILPSPTRDAPSLLHAPVPQPDLNQGLPQTVSDLIVGPSTMLGEGPALVVHDDVKVDGLVTARGIRIMSDERLKTDIVPAHVDALSALAKVSVFEYKLTADPLSQHEIGVVAQNLRKVLPDTVEQDAATGLWGVKLDKLVIYAVKGIQEANTALEELHAKVQNLQIGLSVLMQQQAMHDSSPQHSATSSSISTLQNFYDSDADDDCHMLPALNAGSATNLNSAPADTEQPSISSSSCFSCFPDDTALVQHIMSQLGEANPGMPVKVHKLLHQLGRDATWKAFLEAQHSRMPAARGKTRSPGSTFLLLLKKQEQDAKLRKGFVCLFAFCHACDIASMCCL